MKDIALSFIHFDYLDKLKSCLDSVFSKKRTVDFEVIVVNKESRDGTEALINEKYPMVKLIKRSDSFEIASYRNTGMRAADARYVVNLDVDTLICAGMMEEIVRFMDGHPEVGCVGGKMLAPDGKLQYNCRTFYTLPILIMRRTPLGKLFPNSKIERDHLMADWDHESPREVDWVSGGFAAIRKDAIAQIGYLDEGFKYAFEEVDFSYRLWKSGWKVMYLPSARIVHFENRPSYGFNLLALEHLKSGIKFYLKHKLKI